MKVQISMLVVSLATVLGQVYSSASQMKVELVQVLFRHGERTPLEEDYAALHYADKSEYERYGFGQLTNNGKKQAYKVGRLLRERYDDFLNETYKLEDIFAQSAELDRTQASLQLVLAGLYSKSQWNPVPYRTAPEKLDVLFRQYTSNKYEKLFNDVTDLPFVEEKLDEYKGLFEFLKDKDGVTMTRTFHLLRVFGVLLINSRMNIPLPPWYSDELMGSLRELTVFFADCLTITPEMRRAMAGPLVKTFWERMNLDGTDDNPRKIYLYSGSDYNVAAVARALGINGFRYVDFSNTLILEKLRDSDGRLYVKVLEWNAINEKLFDRKIKGCAEICPVDDFTKICRELFPSDKEMRYLLDDFEGQDVVDLYVKDPLIGKK